MFKPSPISPISKEKWVSNNNNYYQINQEYSAYNSNLHLYPNNNQNPLSPMQKNPISPKVQMFTNNLNTKKNKENIQQRILHNNNFQMFGKHQNSGNNMETYQSQLNQMHSQQNYQNNVNHALNFIKLQCDEVLEKVDRNIGNIYTPRMNENKSFYELNKIQTRQKSIVGNDFKNQIVRQKKSNINLPEEIDLMCDETLQIRDKQKGEKKEPKRFNSQIETQQYKKSPLINKKGSNLQQKTQTNQIQTNLDNPINRINKKQDAFMLRMQKILQNYKLVVQKLSVEKQFYKCQNVALRKLLDEK